MKILIFTLFIFIFQLTFYNLLYSQDYWTRLNGPYGGDAVDILTGPSGNLYALRNEGVYVSPDNAESWTRLPESMVNSNLSMDISSTGTIYVGKSSGGIWWTPNNGQSWDFNPIHIAPHSGLWASVVVTKVSPAGHVYINSYVSFNGGTTFNQIQIGSPAKLPADYAFNSGLVYAATNSGVFYSSDNGSSWTNINGNPSVLNVTTLMFDNNILITGIKGSGVYRTSDNGSSWEPINNGITDFNISKIYRDEQNYYYAGTYDGNVFRSVNSGSSWTLIYSSEAGNTINSISAENGNIFLSTRNYGVLRSNNTGVGWTEKNMNLNVPIINSMAFSNSGEIFSGSYYGINYSSDFGTSWQNRNNGLPSRFINSVYRYNGNTLLAGVYNSGIYRSSDNGMSWASSSSGIRPGAQIKTIRSSPSGFLFAASIPAVFTDTMRLYRSSDNGLNWSFVLQPQTTGIDQFTIDTDGNLFVAGTNSMFEPSILKSTDNGESWEENILEEFFMIQNFTSSGKNLFLTFSNQIFYSSDMGTSWSSIPNGNWSTSGFSGIGINNAGNIFASIGTEVYVTTDMGISWTLKNTGLSSNAVLNKFFFNDAGYIFGTTYNNGVFRSLNSTLTTVISQTENLPGGYILEQNYPNPFNPITNLEFGISNLGFVSLKVYDVLGKEVKTLVNEIKPAGIYKVEFDGSSLSSGIYFYKIETYGFIATKKMVLLK